MWKHFFPRGYECAEGELSLEPRANWSVSDIEKNRPRLASIAVAVSADEDTMDVDTDDDDDDRGVFEVCSLRGVFLVCKVCSQVERILDVRKTRFLPTSDPNGCQLRDFLVKWKGFPSSGNRWVHEDDMNCDILMQEFLQEGEETEKKSRIEKENVCFVWDGIKIGCPFFFAFVVNQTKTRKVVETKQDVFERICGEDG